jgi:hypothetical protein
MHGKLLEFCCGVCEVKLQEMKYIYRNSTAREIANALLFEHAANASGIILTDHNKSNHVHRVLSKIVKPIKLGVNPNSGNVLHIWVRPTPVLKKFIKTEKAKLKK